MKCTKCKINDLQGNGLDALSHAYKYNEICKECEVIETAEQINAYFIKAHIKQI